MSRHVAPATSGKFRVVDAREEHTFPEMAHHQAIAAASELNEIWERFEAHCRRFNEILDAREAVVS